MVTLDFGAPTLKSHLTLALSGDNFRRRVIVEGRGRREPEWVTIVDQAYVFAVPAPGGGALRDGRAPREQPSAPAGDGVPRARRSRSDPDHRRVGGDRGAAAGPARRPIAARITQAEDTQRTRRILTLDLGARHQPFRGVVLDVATPRFWRGVGVEARVDPPRGPRRPAAGLDVPVRGRDLPGGGRRRGAGVAARRGGGPSARDAAAHPQPRRRAAGDRGVTVDGAGGAPRLRGRARPPLSPRATAIRGARRPAYDLARTVGDPALFAGPAREAPLGPPVRPRRSRSSLPGRSATPRCCGRAWSPWCWPWARSRGRRCARRETGANIRSMRMPGSCPRCWPRLRPRAASGARVSVAVGVAVPGGHPADACRRARCSRPS